MISFSPRRRPAAAGAVFVNGGPLGSTASLKNTAISNCSAAGESPQGGAISAYNCTLNLTAVALTGNTVRVSTAERTSGPQVGIPLGSGNGGALFAFASTVRLTDSVLTDNHADVDGGAAYLMGAVTPASSELLAAPGGGGAARPVNLTVLNVTFAGNRGGGDGGAMKLELLSFVRISDASFQGNTAAQGAALFLRGAAGARRAGAAAAEAVTLTAVSFTDNAAARNAGALFLSESGATLTGVLAARNSASRLGGAAVIDNTPVFGYPPPPPPPPRCPVSGNLSFAAARAACTSPDVACSSACLSGLAGPFVVSGRVAQSDTATLFVCVTAFAPQVLGAGVPLAVLQALPACAAAAASIPKPPPLPPPLPAPPPSCPVTGNLSFASAPAACATPDAACSNTCLTALATPFVLTGRVSSRDVPTLFLCVTSFAAQIAAAGVPPAVLRALAACGAAALPAPAPPSACPLTGPPLRFRDFEAACPTPQDACSPGCLSALLLPFATYSNASLASSENLALCLYTNRDAAVRAGLSDALILAVLACPVTPLGVQDSRAAVSAPALPPGAVSDETPRVVIRRSVFVGNTAAAGAVAFTLNSVPPPDCLTPVSAAAPHAAPAGANGPAAISGGGGGAPTTQLVALPSPPPPSQQQQQQQQLLPSAAGCVAVGNIARFFGSLVATNVSSIAVTVPPFVRAGGSLDASVMLRDGFLQPVDGWPDTSVEMQCVSDRCPIFGGGVPSTPYTAANATFRAVTLMSRTAEPAEYVLSFTVAAESLPALQTTVTASVAACALTEVGRAALLGVNAAGGPWLTEIMLIVL